MKKMSFEIFFHLNVDYKIWPVSDLHLAVGSWFGNSRVLRSAEPLFSHYYSQVLPRVIISAKLLDLG